MATLLDIPRAAAGATGPARRSMARRVLALGALALALGLGATVGTALVFEHGFGYIPCALCLAQRLPYYVAAPLSLAAAGLAASSARPALPRLVLVAVGAVMLWSLYLGVHHAGVEWGFWPGPADCAAVAGGDLGGDLLATIDAVHAPSCTVAAGRFLGLSFAGWNAAASLVWAAFAFRLAALRPR